MSASSRHRARERAALARLLGKEEAAGGPFALLGVTPDPGLNDEAIVAALDRQLLRLASHPECDTPEADEVRLALHTAAAQLLDAKVRAHMMAKWGGGPVALTPVEGEAPPTRAGVPGPSSADIPPALREGALAVIGVCGGWNAEATRRLVGFAAQHGLDGARAADLLRAIFDVRPPPAAPPRRAAAPPAPDEAAPLPEQEDPGRRILKYSLLGGLLAIVTLGGSAILAIVLINASRPAPEPRPTPPPTPAPIALAPDPEPAPVEPPPLALGAQTPDAAAAGREIRACAGALASDPAQAGAGFERALAAVAADWPSLAPDALIAVQQDAIEFLYRAAGRDDVMSRAVAALCAPARALAAGGPVRAEDVAPAAWSAGMLTRLLRERDLPAAVELEARRVLAEALAERRPAGEPTFEAGARAAAGLMPPRLVPARSAPEASGPELTMAGWERWLAVVWALERDAPARQAVILAALESILTSGPEPTDAELVFRAVRRLVTSITWRSGDASRRWLLRLFDDQRATSTDLHAVTSALATASSAENVDITMVVPVLASDRVRAEYRRRYARAWGLESGEQSDALMQRLRGALADLGSRADADDSPVACLATAVVLSRFSQAASWLWTGRPDACANLLDHVGEGAEPPPPRALPGASGGGTPPGGGGDIALSVGGGRVRGTWAERYLSAKRNIPIRMQLLDEFPRTASLVLPADAEVLASEAVRGSPADVRARARDTLMAVASSAAIVNALLEQLPGMPATATNSSLIEVVGGRALPGPASAEWESEARRALVERMIELVAAEGEFRRVDALAALLAESYDLRTRPPPGEGAAPGKPPPAEQSAALLWRQARERLEAATGGGGLPGLSLGEIERRRAGRLALARGQVQTFAAHQASACELLALAVSAERPGDLPAVSAVLSRWRERRARANHILEQVQATERAMAELWLIRIGGGSA